MYRYIQTSSKPELGILTDAYNALHAAVDAAEIARTEQDVAQETRDNAEFNNAHSDTVRAYDALVQAARVRSESSRRPLAESTSVMRKVLASFKVQHTLSWEPWERDALAINIIAATELLKRAVRAALLMPVYERTEGAARIDSDFSAMLSYLDALPAFPSSYSLAVNEWTEQLRALFVPKPVQAPASTETTSADTSAQVEVVSAASPEPTAEAVPTGKEETVVAASPLYAIPADAVVERVLPDLPKTSTSLIAAIFAAVKADPNGVCCADTAETRQQEGSAEKQLVYLTRSEFLGRAGAIARVLSGKLDASKYVGVILPPSATCAAVNVALMMLGKIPVNLNYASKTEIVNHCISLCGITQAVSEPVFLKRMKIDPSATIIAASDIKAGIDDGVKAWVGAALAAAPAGLVTSFPGLLAKPEDTATILFTSGSSGMPKGVDLTNSGILHVIRAMQAQLSLGKEKMLGVGPAFHIMGFLGCIAAPLVIGKDTNAEGNERSLVVVYHANSLDAKKVCALVESEQITFFVGIPSMVRMYITRGTKEQFASVKHWVLGAEKVEDALRQDIKKLTGLEVEEIFGATEFGPLASTNVNAEVEINGKKLWGNRPGSVGLMAPGAAVKIIDMDTGATLPRGEQHMGWICVTGPWLMRGYLNQPEKTAEVLKDGWYIPGDYGYVDEDGFLYIVGRMIIKSAGEIIPPLTVRAKILEFTGVDETKLFVIGAKDAKRGERPAVLYTTLGGKTPAEVVAALKDKLPALWIPSASDFAQIEGESLPVGATGKVDMMALKTIAAQKFAAE